MGIFLYGPYVTDGFTTPATSLAGARPAISPAGSPIDPSGSTNPGSVYAGLLNSPPLNFPADMVGGLSNPNLAVTGLSGAAGAIGGTLSQYASKAEALIAEYFGDLTSSNFLGGLSLLGHPRGLPRRPAGAVDHPAGRRRRDPDGDLHPADLTGGRRPPSGSRRSVPTPCSP